MQAFTALRLLIGAAVLLAFAGMMAVVAHEASAGAVAKVTVNSVGNDDDGDCEGPGNTGSGDCTLHEAIDAVNAGLADEINFHKPTFPKANPGVILLDADQGAGKDDVSNCLPPIEREVVINSANTGVILDGDGQNDKPTTGDALGCQRGGDENGVIQVNAQANGWDFTLIGGKNFIIREFNDDTDGIHLCGDCFDGEPYTFGDVLISGYIFQDGDTGSDEDDYDSEDGIDIDETANVANVVIDNVDITADDDGIEISVNEDVTKEKLTNNSIEIMNSRVVGDNDADVDEDGDGIDIDFQAPLEINGGGIDDDSLNGTITVNVHDNSHLASFGDDAVDIDYCDDNDCEAGGDTINVWVNNNAKLHAGNGDGGDNGVEIDIFADDGGPNSGSATIDVQVNGNGLIDAEDGDGVQVDVDVCCDESFSTSSIQVNENDDIIGDDDAVEVDADIGCGDGNVSVVNVNDNGSLEGQTGDGVDVDQEIGWEADDCDDDADDESDANSATTTVNGNERIDGGGGGEDGVELDHDVGGEDANADDNVSVIEIIGNGEIEGTDDGIEVDADAGTADGNDGDENTNTVTINGNEEIQGNDGAGIDIDNETGPDVDIDGTAGDLGAGAPNDRDGDENTSTVEIDGNGSIDGGDGDGIFIHLGTGGNTASSIKNHNVATITNNVEIIGRTDSFGAGIEADLETCCDSTGASTQGTNTLTIADNGDIIGRNADGIFTDLCCAGTNIVTIDNNTSIRGNGNNGIDYDVDIWSDLDGDFDEPCPFECGLFQMLNVLTITNNDIFNSEDDGIQICCGQFQSPGDAGRDPAAAGIPPATAVKSFIANNLIHHNRNHGIQIHSSFGINIAENEIYSNGDDANEDRGIEIDSNVVDDPEEFADFIEGNVGGLGPGSAAFDGIVEDTRANQNRITMNVFYDNVGLPIDLVGDNDQDGDGDHRVGCTVFAAIPSPNDCLPFPVIQTQSVNKLVGFACTDCLVEIYIADDTPADQEPLGIQHGEGFEYLVTATADGDGNWSQELPCGLGNSQLTATATDKLKNTSEFSANFLTLGTGTCATDTPTPAPPTDTPVAPTDTPVPPTATPTTGPVKVCGDADMDGSVTALDALHVLQFKAGFLGAVNNPSNANVNGVDGITSVDAALILQHVAGLLGALNGCV